MAAEYATLAAGHVEAHMRLTISVLALVGLAGCAGKATIPESTDTGTTGGTTTGTDTGTTVGGSGADMPAYCAEVSRVTVTDPSVPSDGFDFAADDAVAVQTGTFTGDLVTYASNGNGQHVSTTLTLHATGIDAVTTQLVDPNTDTAHPPMGQPQTDGCPPYYEIRMDGHLSTTDGMLDEDIAVASHASAPDVGAFTTSIDLGSIQGTAYPTDIDPNRWDAVALVVDASLQDLAWNGSLMWSATNDTSNDTATTTYDTATGVGTGTVGVSGEVSMIGSFSLARTGN